MDIFLIKNNNDQEVFKDVGGFRYNNKDGLLLLDKNNNELKSFKAEEISQFDTYNHILPRG